MENMEGDIVEKLRGENPEQFFILVRMHLSFIVDMNTDDNDGPADKPKAFKWGFSKKGKSAVDSGPNRVTETFNVTRESVNQIYQLLDILADEQNVRQEGIFRRTGSLSRQQLLRRLLSTGGTIKGIERDGQAFSVHDMASVLKGMLADTPEPLLLNQHYHAYCHLAATCFTDGNLNPNTETRLIGALRLLLLMLPTLIWRLTVRLLKLLHLTASFEASNRMSPSALATMFTPHIMCPRKLSPESLHTDSQNLQPILSFMIKNAPQIFIAPPQLVTDISAYLAKREQKRLLSPKGEDLNESVTERTAANTVFTFVDRQMSGTGEQTAQTSKSQVYNTTFTDTALAQLYAHIQALPESQNKRRLIKQFNRENGNGTPLQIQRAQKQKSIGQSLKKHIFNKSLMSKTIKRTSLLQDQGFGYQSIVESPNALNIQQKNDSESCVAHDTPKPAEKESGQTDNPTDDAKEMDDSTEGILPVTPQIIRRKLEATALLTSTPHISNLVRNIDMGDESCSTPIMSKSHISRRGSMSPITKSTQKMPRAMQESIMTPRSRKPVVISCEQLMSAQTIAPEPPPVSSGSGKSHSDNSYNSFSSSSSSASMKNDSDFVSTDESCPSKSYCIKYKRIKDVNYSTRNDSCMNFTNEDCKNYTNNKIYNLNQSVSDFVSDKLSGLSDSQNANSNKTPGQTSLTDPFRQYLLCRSILTESPVDLSFNTGPEDYSENDVDIDKLADDKITNSMLYCLDGNRPNVSQYSDQECLLKPDESLSDSKVMANENDQSSDEALPKGNNKENIAKNKRLARKLKDNYGIENKKILLSKAEKRDDSIELVDGNEFWGCDRHRVLRETNL